MFMYNTAVFIQDITVNGMKITEEDFKEDSGREVNQVNTVHGCVRGEPGIAAKCGGEGNRFETYRKFPYTYNGEKFTSCLGFTEKNVWCPTESDTDGKGIEWEKCSSDCPTKGWLHIK